MSYPLYRHFREFSVYPGHPVTVALEIMLAFEDDVEKALAPAFSRRTGEPLHYSNAVASAEVSGGGSSVRLGCDLISHVWEGRMTPEEAVTWGHKTWERQTLIGGDHREKFWEGQEQAERLQDHLLEHLDTIQVKKSE